jgi:RimJ/RimL family protein N-acetyltransferase
MSGLMMHLMMAHKINPNGDVLYYLGNIAPDAVSDWKKKDLTHVRNLENRRDALDDLARKIDPTDSFAEGILMHLYLDWKWDLKARDAFISKTKGEWVQKYREEIGKASSYAYHHTDWASSIWEAISACDVSKYGNIPGATARECKNFIERNHRWHKETKTKRSKEFSPKFIEKFINKTAKEYVEWKIAHEIRYYNSLPVTFNGFVDVPAMTDGNIEVVCVEKKEGIPEKKRVPGYEFDIRIQGKRIGGVNFRVGYNENLYYSGHIGYAVDKKYRGNRYAEKACRLIVPVIRAHGMDRVIITNNHTNIASKKTCENLGAKFIRLAPLPEWHDLYGEGQKLINVFEWRI